MNVNSDICYSCHSDEWYFQYDWWLFDKFHIVAICGQYDTSDTVNVTNLYATLRCLRNRSLLNLRKKLTSWTMSYRCKWGKCKQTHIFKWKCTNKIKNPPTDNSISAKTHPKYLNKIESHLMYVQMKIL